MAKITLHKDNGNTTTTVPNRFIDEYMTSANGEFVKIYLYLLRCMNSPDCSFSISKTADKFEHTEKDVQRALRYWEKMNLLRLEYDADKNISSIYFIDSASNNIPKAPALEPAVPAFSTAASVPAPNVIASSASVPAPDVIASSASIPAPNVIASSASIPAPNVIASSASIPAPVAVPKPSYLEKPVYTANDMKSFREKEEVQELLFVAESYLGRVLTPTDIQTLLYWYDGLGFSADLIVYLLEHCIAKGHSSLRYMEKVALNWKDSNIKTVEQAKRSSSNHSQIHFSVMKALGISGRNLVPAESAYIEKWSKEFAFTTDIITEACSRTISATHQPSFEYTDRILTNWHQQQVHQMSDIVKLDTAYQKSKTAARSPKAVSNKFNDFPQRSYDIDKLESQLLNTLH